MSGFSAEILAFPTVIYTILLAISLVYWGISMFGVLDLDGMDGADGAAEALDSIDGAADSVDGGAIDGAAAAVDANVDQRQKKGRVPMTISFSLFSLFSWTTSYLVVHNLAANPADPSVAMILAAGAGSAVCGYALSKVVGAPIAKLLEESTAVTSRELIGLECEVTTGSVTEDFGRGYIEDGGAGLLLDIRCESGRLARGHKAVVIDYDKENDTYRVEPLELLLGVGAEESVS